MSLERTAKATTGLAAVAAMSAARSARAVSGVLAIMAGRPRRRFPAQAPRSTQTPCLAVQTARPPKPKLVVDVEAAIRRSVAPILPSEWTFEVSSVREDHCRCWMFAAHARPPGSREWVYLYRLDDRTAHASRVDVATLISGKMRSAVASVIMQEGSPACAAVTDYVRVPLTICCTYADGSSCLTPRRLVSTISRCKRTGRERRPSPPWCA